MNRLQTSPNVTPFIPPLPSPAGRSPGEPPVIPPPSQSSPAWANQAPPQTPATHYTAYPQSPYTGPGFIPPAMGQHTPGPMPGSYFPPPTQLPPTAPHHHPGYSHDYTGFPTAAAGWGPPPQAPPASAPPPWATPAAAPAATPWGQHHAAPPTSPWGQPPAAPYATPWGAPPAQLGTPWHAPSYMPFQQPPVQAPPQHHMGGMGMGMGGMPGGMGMGMGGMSGGMHGYGMPQQGPAPGWGAPMGGAEQWPPQTASQGLSDARAHLPLDVVDKFAAGDYGPVLTPFLARVVRANMKVNPLLQPPDDTDRVYLKWNMLFYSGHCQRSDDRPTHSWSNGRNQPATFPRVTELQLVSKSFPWIIKAEARKKEIGVTCGDVIDAIDAQLHSPCAGGEYNSRPREEKRKLNEAYHHNRSTAHGVPGGQLGEGMRRCDWLYQDTQYGGIQRNDESVRRICGEVLPCTFELKCIHRYPMTADEIRAQEAREREISRKTERERTASVRSSSMSRRSSARGRDSTTGDDSTSDSD